MKRTLQIAIISVSFLTTTFAPGQEWNTRGFETWDEAAAFSLLPKESGSDFENVATRTTKAGQTKIQPVSLKEENSALKHQMSIKEKPDIKWGCYYFDDDESRLYCTACYDTKGMRSLTTRMSTKFRKCNVCGAISGT